MTQEEVWGYHDPMRTLLALSASALPASAQFAESPHRVHAELRGGALGQNLGAQVAALGDVDGDGVGDFAASAPDYEAGVLVEVGKVFAFSGRSGAVLWTFSESIEGIRLGTSLEAADWNLDGVQDVIAGAPFKLGGRVWILSGIDGSVLARLDSPLSALWFGYSIAAGGDLNGNGVPDFIVSAPDTRTAAGQHTGRLYFYECGFTPLIYWNSLDGPVHAGEFGTGLAILGDISVPPDGKAEFVAGTRLGRSQSTGVYWEGQARAYTYTPANGRFAEVYSVDGVGLGLESTLNPFRAGGDADADGFPDFVATDSYFRELRLISGRAGTRLRTISGFGDVGDFEPRADLIDDIDGDGSADLAIGTKFDSSSAQEGGRIYLCSGTSGNVLATITGTTNGLHLGASLLSAGDFDGDGRPDLIVGATGTTQHTQPEGRAYVLSAHLSAPPNLTLAAQAPGDPSLSDAGGDPEAGPLLASALEPFALALDCSGSASGPWLVHGHQASRVSPYASPTGWIWLAGARLFTFSGSHASNTVTIGPVVLPPSVTLVGLRFTSQGLCGGGPTRTSSALTQELR